MYIQPIGKSIAKWLAHKLPVDQDVNGDFSLSEKQDDDNDIFVAEKVMEDNAKSGERDNKGNNENESSSICCQQEQGVSRDNVNIRNSQNKDPELKLIMDYLENGDLPNDERKVRELVLGRSLYQVVKGILYHMEPDKSLRFMPPENNWESLFL